MAIVTIDTRDRTPIYAQLERALRAAIATGRLQAGDQLPTVRQLAVDLSVNANTVARVYAELERAGVIETRRGVGSFVNGTAAARAPAARTRSPPARLRDAHARGSRRRRVHRRRPDRGVEGVMNDVRTCACTCDGSAVEARRHACTSERT